MAWLIFSGVQYHDYFFLYLSNWTFIFITAYFFFALYLTVISCFSGGDGVDKGYGGGYGTRRFKSQTYIVGLTSSDDTDTESENEAGASRRPKNEEENKLGWFHKTTWLFFTIASTNSLVVTVIYWSSEVQRQPSDSLADIMHTLNSVFMLVEVVISNIPVRLLHHFYSHIFESLYFLFTVIYWATGGEDLHGNNYIYQLLDYTNDPAIAVGAVFLVLIVLQPVAQLLIYILFRFRGWVVSKLD